MEAPCQEEFLLQSHCFRSDSVPVPRYLLPLTHAWSRTPHPLASLCFLPPWPGSGTVGIFLLSIPSPSLLSPRETVCLTAGAIWSGLCFSACSNPVSKLALSPLPRPLNLCLAALGPDLTPLFTHIHTYIQACFHTNIQIYMMWVNTANYTEVVLLFACLHPFWFGVTYRELLRSFSWPCT